MSLSNRIILDPTVFSNVKGKNVIFTGGASGIGREAVILFAQQGANVVFGDIDLEAGKGLAEELGANVKCHRTDVASLESLKSLFAVAEETFGPADIVCANAGIHEHEDWLSEEYLKKNSSWPSIQINFVGVLNTIKLALLSFRRSGKSGSIVLTASASGYEDSAPVCAYGGTKHAVVGLLRSFRTITPNYNTRINLVAPWMVKTPFAGPEVMARFGDLPLNSPEGCAKAIVYAASHPEIHGKGILIGGDEYFELEEGYSRTRPQWMGETMAANFQEGWKRCSAVFGKGGDLAKLH